MKNQAILFGVLFCSHVAFADVSENILRDILGDVQDQVQELNNQNINCSLDSDKNEEDLFQACAQDLCGLPNPEKSPIINDKNFDQYFGLVDRKTIEEKKKKYFAEAIKQREKLKKKLDQVLKLSKFDLLKMDFPSSLFEMELRSLSYVKNVNGKFQFEVRPDLDKNPKLKLIAESYGKFRIDKMNRSPLELYSHGIWSKEDVKKRAPSLIKELEELMRVGLGDELVQDSIDSLKKGRGHISEMDSNELVDYLSSYEVALINQEKSFECLNECQTAYSEYLFERAHSPKIYDFRKDLESDSFINEYVSRKVANDLFQEGMLDRGRVENLTKLHLQSEQNLSLFLDTISPTSFDRFEKTMKSNFEIQSYPKSSLSTLESENTEIEDLYSDLQKLTKGDLFDLIPGMQSSVSVMWDRANHIPSARKSELNLSFFSSVHGEEGVGIINHEQGHLLSAYMNLYATEDERSRYQMMRTCVSQNRKRWTPDIVGRMPPYWIHPEDNLFSEEDMADLVADYAGRESLVMRNCSLLEQDLGHKKYLNLKLVETKGMEEHSPSFYRLIMEGVRKNKELPASCKQIMILNRDQFRFNKCF